MTRMNADGGTDSTTKNAESAKKRGELRSNRAGSKAHLIFVLFAFSVVKKK